MKRVLLILAVLLAILVGELLFPIQVLAAPPAQDPVVGKYYELLRGLKVFFQPTMTSKYVEFGRGCTLKVLRIGWAEGVVWVQVRATTSSGFSQTGWILEGIFHDRAWLRLIQTVIPAAPVPAPWVPAPVIPIVPNPNIYPWWRWQQQRPPRRWA